MKELLCFLLFLNLTNLICAQNIISHQIEFGIDLTTPIIWASGGDRSYHELEFIYRESQYDKDLRFKLNINNYNFYGRELVAAKQLEDNKPISLKYVQVKYIPRTSYVASLGISKYLSENKLPIYFGLDWNIGMGRGETWTNLKTIILGEDSTETIFRKGNSLMILGVTPVIGIKKDITERIVFGIEFGASANAILGKIEYRNANGETNTVNVDRLELTLNSIINDIVLLIKI